MIIKKLVSEIGNKFFILNELELGFYPSPNIAQVGKTI